MHWLSRKLKKTLVRIALSSLKFLQRKKIKFLKTSHEFVFKLRLLPWQSTGLKELFERILGIFFFFFLD